MEEKKRKIHVIGINSFKFEELSLSLQNLFLEIKNIAVPISYISYIRNWSIKYSKNEHNFFKSKSDIDLIKWIKKQDNDLILISRGDPLWFGIGRILIENFSKRELYFYPSSTSMQLAFSKLKRSWQESACISLHGRDTSKLIKALKLKHKNLAIITDQRNGLELIRKNINELKLENIYECWLCEDLGYDNEKITEIKPEDLIPRKISEINIVILLRKENCISKSDQPLFGLNDSLFKTFEDRPNLITKREIRIQILADLELPFKGVLWDIGSGSGTIGLEALRLRPDLKLFCIDKRLGTKSLIIDNAKMLGVFPEQIIEGDIKELLKLKLASSMPLPSRVIIGGCDENTKIDIIQELSKKQKKDHIIVIPIITFEVLQKVKRILEEFEYETSINLIQTSKGISIAEGTRFEPNNPVFIIKGRMNVE